MKEKISIITGAGIAALVIIVVIFFITGSKTTELSEILMIITPIILVIGVIAILWDRIKNIKSGLPSADERAKKLTWKAGAYAYFTTIWIAVGTLWYNIIFAENLGYPEINAGQVVAIIVLLSGIFWFIFQFYFMRKGDIE